MLPPKRVHINSLIIQVQYTPLFVIFIILQDFVLLNIVKNLNSEEFNNCSFDILLFGAYRSQSMNIFDPIQNCIIYNRSTVF